MGLEKDLYHTSLRHVPRRRRLGLLILLRLLLLALLPPPPILSPAEEVPAPVSSTYETGKSPFTNFPNNCISSVLLFIPGSK